MTAKTPSLSFGLCAMSPSLNLSFSGKNCVRRLILPLPDIFRPGREAVSLEGNPQEGFFQVGFATTSTLKVEKRVCGELSPAAPRATSAHSQLRE